MTEPFLVTTRVKQGCVIVPTLFSIYIAAVLHLAPGEPPQVIPLRYRTDCNVFNLARLKAKTKIKSIVARELQYADDAEAGALTEVRLQTTVDVFTEAYGRLGLQVNTRKSKVLYQPAPTPQQQQDPPPAIKIHGKTLENVQHFTYLDCELNKKATIDDDVPRRLGCARMSFGRLQELVFEERDQTQNTKLTVYKAAIIPTMLYGAEVWTTYQHHLKVLEKYHQRCLRRILKIS